MSEMEYNKGKLFPTTWETITNYYTELTNDSDLEYDTDGNYVKLGDDYYEIIWEVKRGDELPELLNLTKHSDGSIEFETYHYNGGADWTEIVEEAL